MRNARVIRSVLLPFRRTELKVSYVLGAVVGVMVGSVTMQQAFGQASGYLVTELSSADAGAVPFKLNNLGDMAGNAANAAEGGTRATIWNHSDLKKKHLRALLGSDYSSASAINDAGEVAGVSNTSKAMLPYIWTLTGGLQRVPLLPGDNCGQANGINKQGHVAGYSSGPNGARAFLWTRSKGVQDLGVLPGGNYSRACDLNDLDQVAGTSGSAAGDRAVLWTKTGNVRDLGTLSGDTSSEATAINNNGDVVGYSKGPRGGMRAFLWTQASGMEDLGILPGGNSSRALGINDKGAVVGISTSASGDHAFLWTKETGITDLNSAESINLDVVFMEAHAINGKGAIIASGRVMHEMDGSGQTVATAAQQCAPAPPSMFLLTPTPAK
jgi:probable HAF family extracellular repeat protein